MQKTCKYTLESSNILKPLKKQTNSIFNLLSRSSYLDIVLKNQPILQNSKNPSILKHNLKQLIVSTNKNNDSFKFF